MYAHIHLREQWSVSVLALHSYAVPSDLALYVAAAGCPEKGDLLMKCKEGFGGPLCAVCHEGYFKSIRDCKRCESPRVGTLAVVAFVLGLIVLVTLLLFLSWRYPHYINNAAAFSRKCHT